MGSPDTLRPLLLATPNLTPLVASAGHPVTTISPLLLAVRHDANSAVTVPELGGPDDEDGASGAYQVQPTPDRTLSSSWERASDVHFGEQHSPVLASLAPTLDALGEADALSATLPVQSLAHDVTPQPRFYNSADHAQPPAMNNSTNDVAIGRPRVLGLPVGMADAPLPENCCEQRCARCMPASELTLRQRYIWSRTSYFAAVNVLLICIFADSFMAQKRMPWDGTLTKAQTDELSTFYVRGCLAHGKPPTAILFAVILYGVAALTTFLMTVTVLVASRGCILCCAPASCCGDKVCSAQSLVALTPLVGTITLLLYTWLLYWPLADLTSCNECHIRTPNSAISADWPAEVFSDCAARLHLDTAIEYNLGHLYFRGMGCMTGFLSACAIAMAGSYCSLVPSAINSAIGQKQRSMAMAHRQMLANNMMRARLWVVGGGAQDSAMGINAPNEMA